MLLGAATLHLRCHQACIAAVGYGQQLLMGALLKDDTPAPQDSNNKSSRDARSGARCAVEQPHTDLDSPEPVTCVPYCQQQAVAPTTLHERMQSVAMGE